MKSPDEEELLDTDEKKVSDTEKNKKDDETNEEPKVVAVKYVRPPAFQRPGSF